MSATQEQLDALAKLRQLVDHIHTTWQGWHDATPAKASVAQTIVRKDMVKLALEMGWTANDQPFVDCAITVPHMQMSTDLVAHKRFSLKTETAKLAAKIFAFVTVNFPSIDAKLAVFALRQLQLRNEIATLQTLQAAFGGKMDSYMEYKTMMLPGGPKIHASIAGPNDLNLNLNHLSNNQVHAITKLIADADRLPTFPHPSETLTVDDQGAISCTDIMVGTDWEDPESWPRKKRIYTIRWMLAEEEWRASATIANVEYVLLTVMGTTFPSDDCFAEAAAALERRLNIRLGE